MKYLYGLFAFVLVLIFPTIINAQFSINTNEQTGQVTISGYDISSANKPVTCIILNSGKTEADINLSGVEQNINFTKATKSDTFGNYEFKFVINPTNRWTYKAIINSNGLSFESKDFSYISLNDLAQTLNSINMASVDELLLLLPQNVEKFNLKYEDFNMLSEQSKRIMAVEMEKIDFSVKSDFSDAIQKKQTFSSLYTKYLIVGMLNDCKNVDDVNLFFENSVNLSALGIDVILNRTPYYANFSSNTLDMFNKYIANQTFESIDSALAKINEAVLLYTVYDKRYTNLSDVIDAISLIVPIDKTYYNTLNASDKLNTYLSVAGKEFADLYHVANSFENEAKRLYNLERSSSNTGGGGGGVHTTKFSPEMTVVTPVPILPPDKVISKDFEKPVFNDIGDYKWATSDIKKLYEKGIINGKAKGMFDPSGNITRAEFIKIVVIAFNIKSESKRVEFADVSGEEWYFPYVNAAAVQGIITGYNGEFNPNRGLTREEMAVVLFRVAKLANLELSHKTDIAFNDKESIQQSCIEAVNALASVGIVNGISDGIFAPKELSNRAQVARVVSLLIDLKR